MIKPKTRLEEFFAKIAGIKNVRNIVPMDRLEKWLEKISQNMLPAATAADAGKVVAVDENGNYVLVEGGAVAPVANDTEEYKEGLLDRLEETDYQDYQELYADP